ncbi:TPA: glutaminase [Salmonella enterica]|nr:glutaminase [Salmonella enterica]HCL5083512.1 glutaminase [Salmonella enterica]HCL5333139.1 glutaminase [Salmonella enterica]
MKCSAIAASLSVGLLLSMSASATGSANYSDVVNQAWQKFKDDNSGKVADYIPALAKYSAGNYAIALATVDGKLYLAGNTGQKFPLESLTKIFTLAMVLNQYGSDEVLNKLGANATGLPFNSGLAIELRSDRLQNPLVSEMVIAGLYDDSGKWLYSVGLPAKSGVGGGMVAVVPGQYAVAVYSPPLDPQGNSVRAQEAIRYIANGTGSSLWQPH